MTVKKLEMALGNHCIGKIKLQQVGASSRRRHVTDTVDALRVEADALGQN